MPSVTMPGDLSSSARSTVYPNLDNTGVMTSVKHPSERLRIVEPGSPMGHTAKQGLMMPVKEVWGTIRTACKPRMLACRTPLRHVKLGLQRILTAVEIGHQPAHVESRATIASRSFGRDSLPSPDSANPNDDFR